MISDMDQKDTHFWSPLSPNDPLFYISKETLISVKNLIKRPPILGKWIIL